MTRSFNPVYASLPTTIFEVMSQLAREHDAVNLGQLNAAITIASTATVGSRNISVTNPDGQQAGAGILCVSTPGSGSLSGHVFNDSNGNGVVDGGDTLLGTAVYSGSTAVVTFVAPIPASATQTFLVTFTFSATAHAVLWNARLPRFADCVRETMQIDAVHAAALLDGASALMAMGALVRELREDERAARDEFAARFATFASRSKRMAVRETFR